MKLWGKKIMETESVKRGKWIPLFIDWDLNGGS